MGRELRRKEAKRNGKDLKKEEVQVSNEWQKTVLIIGIVIIVLVALYFVLAIFVTDEFSDSTNNTSDTRDAASTVENPILANAIFSQSDDVYYVYCFDFGDADTNVNSVINNNLSEEKVYRVNTKDALNSKYVAEEGNKKSSSLDNLVISNPTLLKVEKGKITMYLEGATEIISHYE